MKWHSPIFFCISLLLACCQKSVSPDAVAIADLLDKAVDEKRTVNERLHLADSAEALFQTTNDDILRFRTVAIQFDLVHDAYPDSTEIYLRKLEKVARTSDQQSSFLIRKAEWLQENEQHLLAYQFFKLAKTEAEKTADSIKIGYALMGMAGIANIFNDYSGGQETTTEALIYLYNTNRPDYQVQAYNLLGITYSSLHDYSNAIQSYTKALALSDSESNKNIIRNNIGFVHIRAKQFDRALLILQPLATAYQSNPLEKARVLHNFGYAKFKNNGTGTAEMLQSLAIRESIGAFQDLSQSYLDLSEHYSSNPTLARKYSIKALRAAEKINSIDHRIDALIQLVKLSTGNESKSAFLEYERLNDSITSVRRQAKNEFAKQKYDVRKSDLENTALKIRNLRIERRNLLFVILIGLVMVISSAVLYWIRKRSIRARRLEAYHTETRLAKKIHDELANDVYYTMAFAEQQDLTDMENRETLLNNLDNIYSRTRDISHENNSIETGERFAMELKELLSRYNSHQISVILTGFDSVPWLLLDPPLQIQVYRLVQELLTNMKKHSNCSRAIFSFRFEKRKITIEYSDDGIGVQSEKTFFKKNLPIMENRIRGINGVLTFENTSGKGFRLSFTFPLKQ